jgi:hypothetical protein
MLDQLRQVTRITSHTDPFQLDAADQTVLSTVRLQDAVGKMRAHQFLRLMLNQYQDMGLTPDRTEVGYSNGRPLISAFWTRPDGVEVGWQFQGQSWRLALVVHHIAGKSAEQIAARAAYARTQPWFDFGPFHDVLDQPHIGGALPFGRFNPAFVYTKQEVPADISVRLLLLLATTYGTLAQQAATS